MTWYTGDPTYDTVLAAAFGLAALVALASPFVASPYGRFASDRWGFAVDPRLGWFLMELPSTVVFLVFYFRGPHRFEPVPLAFLAVWLVHYGNRGFFFPLSKRVPRGAKSSFGSWCFHGWVVTSLHGYLNGTFASSLAGRRRELFADPRFPGGPRRLRRLWRSTSTPTPSSSTCAPRRRSAPAPRGLPRPPGPASSAT
jgi:3-oxo-5-alpha-steroid 4-dehydrogenase 1